MVSANFKLHGLDAAGRYSVTNLDLPGSTEMTGHDLMERGLLVSLQKQPDSALITYRKVK
jgi:Glycosyl hydrolase family 36 C-terminal domain